MSRASTLPAAATTGDLVPFVRLDAADPELFAELLEVVERVAREAAFTLGQEVAGFESDFAAACDAEHAVGVSSGTAALELALRGLGIGPGDEVIVPTFTFIATAEAVSAAGATPVLVDVIPVHLFGRTVDLQPIVDLCHRRGVAVIEDACQAHGARYRGRRVGSIGDAGCFSFYPTKNLGGWGDGGALTTDDADLAARVRLLRSHGESPRHNHQVAARTDRLDALQAAILTVKLRHLDEWNAARRAAAARLSAELAGSGLKLPAPPAADGDHVYHLFVVRTAARDAFRDHLDAAGIASAIHYPTPVHLQPCYAGLGLGPGSLPAAEALAAESCSLPIFPAIEERHITEIVAASRGFDFAAGH